MKATEMSYIARASWMWLLQTLRVIFIDKNGFYFQEVLRKPMQDTLVFQGAARSVKSTHAHNSGAITAGKAEVLL